MDMTVKEYEGLGLPSFEPRTFSELQEFARLAAPTEFVPKDFRNQPDKVMLAVMAGREIGLRAMAAIQGICVINGRPSVFGATGWALVKVHPLTEWTREEYDHTNHVAIVTVKRRGDPQPHQGVFSKADAQAAKLLSKDTYTGYLRDMLTWRARYRAANAAVPEALRGITFVETARDMGTAERVDDDPPMPTAAQRAAFNVDLSLGSGSEPAPIGDPPPEGAPPPPAPAPAPAPSSPPPSEDDDPSATRVTGPMVNILNAKLADGELRNEFLQHFKIADPSELPRRQMNAALDWIRRAKGE